MHRYIHKLGFFGAMLIIVSIGSPAAFALPYEPSISTQTGNAPATTGTESNQTVIQNKLSDAKLKVCQNRQQAIRGIMTRIADRGQKHLALFTTIAERVETFYKNKGKVLSSYDALVADVEAKASLAQTTVTNVSSADSNFNCDGSDPKGIASSFLSSLKLEISALQAYRTAVKNLIVGVKSVESTSASATQTNGGGSQ
jgi:hypothetical protein